MNHTLRSIIEAELEKAVLAEREACAKICDAAQLFGNDDERWSAKCCAEAIRARGENVTDNN